ncbi:hypothetical protein ACIA49_17695 [Kribbella sp. NPDC051587]|uniref:hypothetical protein n=1 Tax=Kribbella sp. NPDC051587 TaxID=3364119 RepID=UPI00378920C3
MYDDNITPGDERVSTLFHDTARDVEVDVAALVSGGITRGRAKHRLQTAGTAFAAAVGVVGVVGAALTVGPGLGSGGVAPAGAPAVSASTPTPLVPPTSKPVPPPANKPSGKPSGKPTNIPPPPTAEIPVRAASLPGTFTQLFPGKITQAEKRTGRIIDDGKQNQIAHFLWKGYLTTVAFSAYSGTPAQRCAEISRQGQTCAARPDGTFLLSDSGQEPAVDGGGRGNSAMLITKDHYEIFIQSYTYGRKGGPNLSSQPPFSQEQLKQAVTSKTWF